ncbi:CotD family spore coat protein [Petrocella atlantisensis]|uniref:CotD family spore coat protein n=1 Tax=Petrocella atlantisensis TaxID=2173034 RepID=UPI000F63A36F
MYHIYSVISRHFVKKKHCSTILLFLHPVKMKDVLHPCRTVIDQHFFFPHSVSQRLNFNKLKFVYPYNAQMPSSNILIPTSTKKFQELRKRRWLGMSSAHISEYFIGNP